MVYLGDTLDRFKLHPLSPDGYPPRTRTERPRLWKNDFLQIFPGLGNTGNISPSVHPQYMQHRPGYAFKTVTNLKHPLVAFPGNL
jgi:hypothetical protein